MTLQAVGLPAATLALQVPVEPGREQARGWALQELAGREYAAERPGLLARGIQRVLEWLTGLDLPAGTGSSLVLSVVLAALLVLTAVAAHRTGGLRRQARAAGAGPVLAGRRRTAAEHRAAADRHASAAQWSAAVIERFRGIARELQERAVIAVQPGRTAAELAADAATWLPALQPSLHAAAVLFDGVRYGQVPATAADDDLLRRLDADVQRARPRTSATQGPPEHASGGWTAVPG
jgi:hypothetical protein